MSIGSSIAGSLLDGLGRSAGAFVELETADSKYVLAARDGSLVTLLSVGGVASLVGGPEFDVLVGKIADVLNTAVGRGGHIVQLSFSRDPLESRRAVRESLDSAIRTSGRLGLDLSDLFDEKTKVLSDWCAQESVLIAVWTTPDVLPPDSRKEAIKDRQFERDGERKSSKWRSGSAGQDIYAGLARLREKHRAVVSNFEMGLSQTGFLVRALDCHTALRQIRHMVDPDVTPEEWRPRLPGDKIPVRYPDPGEDLIDCVQWPQVAQQVVPRPAEVLDLETVRLGDRYIRTFSVTMPQLSPVPFGELFSYLREIPWRILFRFEGNGIGSLSWRPVVAQILSFVSARNKQILAGAEDIRARFLAGQPVVRISMAVCTWGEDGKEVRRNASILQQALNAWGGVEATARTGDPFLGLVSTVPGLSRRSVAPVLIAPLSEVAPTIPVRPASVFEKGALLLRSPDGKILPFQPGSPLQSSWIELGFAPSGGGKSVFSNALNLALSLLPGLRRLPRIAILDIGPSSSGLISLLKGALPEGKKHLAAHYRVTMSSDYSVNPFDLPLGYRTPLPAHRAFLANFLSLLATPLGANDPYDGVSGIASLVVDRAYSSLEDREANASPREYAPHIDPVVDQALSEIAFPFEKHPKLYWWDVVDALYDQGRIREAWLAQTHAVPNLKDIPSIASDPAVTSEYRLTTPTGESVVEYFKRRIQEAIREYPILAGETKFDLGEARVVALDLDAVCPKGSGPAARQTAVMYLLGRYMLVRDFFLDAEEAVLAPDRYKAFHLDRARDLKEDAKRLVFDEFHRTDAAPLVRTQVMTDIREGRKRGIQIALFSQSINDFDETMVDLSTSVWILGAATKQAIDKAGKIFGFSESVLGAMEKIGSPSKAGANLIARMVTNRGTFQQFVTNTLGPIELWAFSTTSQDAVLRDELYRLLGPVEARKRLATRFPGGSAREEIERRSQNMKDRGESGDADKTVVQQLVEEMEKKR
ncbi:IcmB [Leptospirillum ferrooxidans]|uniref:Putative IcmB n=1 Tax=Leptospirillum ferrooxidans (strain C2-3) TaxID=1162668 RepID=I0IM44_LEPFC|nr:IcmB [Leptospirillum ferrooxidans]BAM06343.1 putative IcmB [Leptospirillum ferrooxidans C2-3]